MDIRRNLDKIHALFPKRNDPVEPGPPLRTAINAEDVEPIHRKMVPGAAPGLSGLRVDHLLQLYTCRRGNVREELLHVLAQVITDAAGGLWPSRLAQWFGSGKITPLLKKDGGVRPAVAPETLRALVSRFVLHSCSGVAQDHLTTNQKGFTPGKNGGQMAIYTVREWAKDLSRKMLVKVDLANAFNTVSRAACCKKAEEMDPLLGSWARWTLSSETALGCGGLRFTATTGLLQGDPLAPLLFRAGITDTLGQMKSSVGRFRRLVPRRWGPPWGASCCGQGILLP